MRKWLILVVLVLVPSWASAQTLGSGTLGAADATVCTSPIGQSVAVNFQMTGTFSGTVTFQGVGGDGVSTASVIAAKSTGATPAATTTTTGIYAITNTGYTRLCATMTSYSSGAANVFITRGYGSGGSGSSGGGGSGCAGTAGTPCIVAGNDAAGSPTAGTVLAVQGIASGTNLNVNCAAGCSGGTQYTQDAALTVATSVGTMAMGRASAAAPTDVSADNDAVLPWYLRSGAGVTQPTFGGVLASAGNGASGTGVQRVTVANDSTGILAGVTTVTTLTGGGVAAGSADSGNPVKVGGIYSSSLPTLTNGQRGNLQLTASGATIVAPSLTGAFATDTTTNTAASTTGPQIMLYGSAATPSAVGADGRAIALWGDTVGRPQVNTSQIGGVAPTLNTGVVTTGTQRVTLATDVNVPTNLAQVAGATISQTNPVPVSFPGTLVSGTITSAMTGTTSTSLVSGTASNFLYIGSCVVSNASTTVSTDILLQDGSGGTTLAVIPAPAAAVATTGGGGATHTFGPYPLKVPTSGNALFAANVTTGSSTKISCNGFRSTTSY